MALSRRLAGVQMSGIRRIFDRAAGVKGLINLGIGEPDFEVPDFVREALKDAVDSGVNRYTPNRGTIELRREISKKLERENRITADPTGEIIVTAGATQAIFVLMSCVLNPGDEVLVPSPGFVAYRAAARLAGGRPVDVEMDENAGYSLDAERLEKHCTKKTKLLVINSPANPTGAVYSRAEILEACEFAASKGILVLSDEIYERYVYDGERHFSPASVKGLRNHVVTVGGLSKTYAITGWRVGYAAGNERIIGAMARYNMYNAVCASSIVQAAAAAALAGPQSFFDSILSEFDRRRRTASDCLEGMGFTFVKPKGAFYVFPRIVAKRRDSNVFCESLLSKHRVATIPGAAFGRGGEGHIRISYAVREEALRKAMSKLRKFKAEWER